MRNTQQENRFLTVDFFLSAHINPRGKYRVCPGLCSCDCPYSLHKSTAKITPCSVPGRGRRARPTNEARSLCVSSAMQGEVFFFFFWCSERYKYSVQWVQAD